MTPQPPSAQMSPGARRSTTPPYVALLSAAVLVKLAIFLTAGTNYGYLADELYFLDAAERLAAGYVDFPPAIAWLIAAHTGLFGNGLLGLRALALVIGTATTLLAIDLTRRAGGGRTAQALTAVVVVFAPAFLSVQSILTMNVLDQLWWVLGFWLLLRYLDRREPNDMRWLGVVYGLALLTKLSIPFWVASLGLTSLLYARWIWRRPETWQGALLAAVIASPFLLWQVANGWPFAEFISAYNAQPPEAMVIDQPLFGLITTMNPPFALIWLPGLIWGVMIRDRTLRMLGTAAAVCLTAFLATGVKFYFATPLFVIFALLGSLLWERWLAGRVGRAMLIGSLGVSGLMSIPIGAPVLPAPLLQKAADFIRDGEQGFPGDVPAPLGRYFPHFAEMHGWPELVSTVAGHYGVLAEENPAPTLVAAYFGQAGALNQLDDTDALPVAHSGHVNYHLWSAEADFRDAVFVGFEPALIESLYDDVTVLGRSRCERCMARDNGVYIIRARKPTASRGEIVEAIKRYYFF